MSCYPKYQIMTYFQNGPLKGYRREIIYCNSLEEARERRQNYIVLDNCKDAAYFPTIHTFRKSEYTDIYDYFYLEG